MNSAADEMIDAKLFQEVRAVLGDDASLRRLLARYEESAEAALARLSAAAAAGDGAEVIEAAHYLRGSSAGLGARKLAALCAALEEGAGGTEASALLAAILLQYPKTREALREAGRRPAGREA